MSEDNRIDSQIIIMCPFCGNEEIRTWQTEDNYWHIQCDSDICGAIMNDFNNRNEAIKQWNTRAYKRSDDE